MTYERKSGKKVGAITGIIAVVALLGTSACLYNFAVYAAQETVMYTHKETLGAPETVSENSDRGYVFGQSKDAEPARVYLPDITDTDREPSQLPAVTSGAIKSDTADNSTDDAAATWRMFMLELINDERIAAGLDPVIMGNNTAAQTHADSMLAECFSSHWGLDGLKPYTRYSLAGGYQYNAENVSGLSYCIKPWENYIGISLGRDIRKTMDGLMQSPGHRDNILDPHHMTVNIGMAWDDHNMQIVQHFEYGYAIFDEIPTIRDGTLSFSGTAINGAGFGSINDLGVQVYYDPPPRNLTTGQVSRTYCYDSGGVAATLLPPPPPGYYYTTSSYQMITAPCPDPYDVPADTPAPASHDQAHDAWYQAYLASISTPASTQTVPFHIATEWSVSGDDFTVEADIRPLLQEYGPGIYSVVLWGVAGGEEVTMAERSIFYEIEPPAGYG